MTWFFAAALSTAAALQALQATLSPRQAEIVERELPAGLRGLLQGAPLADADARTYVDGMVARNLESGIFGGDGRAGFHLDVRAHGMSLTEPLRQYAAEHLAAKLAKHNGHIQSVVIRLVDVNGSKGGEDKTCEVEVYVRAQAPVVVSATEHDLHAAIDAVADRVQSALGRELARGRDLPRQRGRKLVRGRKALH